MKVVITGGTGFIGQRLARLLLDRGTAVGPSGRSEEIDDLVLFDAVAPERLSDGLGAARVVAGDVADRETIASLIDRGDCTVFHLASIVSAGAEKDFDLALRVNLQGGLNVLEACRALALHASVVLASTYARLRRRMAPRDGVGPDQADAGDDVRHDEGDPRAARERLHAQGLSRRSLGPAADGDRAPGQARTSAASSWVSAVFREPLHGRGYVLPVGLDLRHPVAGVRTVVEGLDRLHSADPAALSHDRAVTFPSVSVTAGEMVECVQRVGAGPGAGRDLGAARSGHRGHLRELGEARELRACARPRHPRATRASSRSSRPTSTTTSEPRREAVTGPPARATARAPRSSRRRRAGRACPLTGRRTTSMSSSASGVPCAAGTMPRRLVDVRELGRVGGHDPEAADASPGRSPAGRIPRRALSRRPARESLPARPSPAGSSSVGSERARTGLSHEHELVSVDDDQGRPTRVARRSRTGSSGSRGSQRKVRSATTGPTTPQTARTASGRRRPASRPRRTGRGSARAGT